MTLIGYVLSVNQRKLFQSKLPICSEKEKSVLEQKWPEVDNDYNLDLQCVVNNQQACTLKIPRWKLDSLDETLALTLLQQNEIYIKYYGTQKISNIKFDHYPGMDAILNVIMEPKQKATSESANSGKSN